MSLQLSKTKPRQLQYAVGGLREDYKLIELDESLLDAITNDQCVARSLCCAEAEHAACTAASRLFVMCVCCAGC